jgi:DNA-binding cell septation regulator SpoVG
VPLEVTAVRIFPFDLTSVGQQTVAFAEVEFDGVMVVRGIRVHKTPAGGLFISFPTTRSPRSGFTSLVEVTDPIVARSVRDAVVQAFKEISPPAESPRGPSAAS